MGCSAGPNIVEDGLVLALDAGNTKGYDKYENLITYSEDFTQSIWDAPVSGKSRATRVTSTGIDDPSGGTTAATYKNGGTAADELIWRAEGGTANVPYTMSVWIRRRTGTGQINLVVGDNIAVEVTNQVTTEWKRISVTATPTQTTIRAYIQILGINDEIDIWGYQLEQGESATDYYATTGTAKTRGSVVSSGLGTLTGTLTNGVGYDNVNGGYFDFDGTNDYIDCGTSNTLNFTTAFSVSFWMNNNISTNTLEYFVNRWTYSTGAYRQWSIDSGGDVNRINFRISSDGTDGGSTGIKSTNASYSVGWHNICGTWNGSVISLYVDGVLVAGPTEKTSMVSTPGQSTFIGGGNLGNTLPMSGNIAQVSIYNKALTASEIEQNFNALRGRFGI